MKRFQAVGRSLQQVVANFFEPGMTPTGSRKFNNRQNYCEMKVGPPHPQTGLPPLAFSLIVLGGDPVDGDEIGDTVRAEVPPLLPADTDKALAASFELEAWKPPARRCFCF